VELGGCIQPYSLYFPWFQGIRGLMITETGSLETASTANASFHILVPPCFLARIKFGAYVSTYVKLGAYEHPIENVSLFNRLHDATARASPSAPPDGSPQG
jgi:hypothetical protein